MDERGEAIRYYAALITMRSQVLRWLSDQVSARNPDPLDLEYLAVGLAALDRLIARERAAR
jgi:hypothetical protein